MPGWPHAVATSRHRLNASARGAAFGTSTAPRRTRRATIPAPRMRQLSNRASAHPYAQVISMARSVDGVMGLTRCTAAKGPAHTSGPTGPVCAISLTSAGAAGRRHPQGCQIRIGVRCCCCTLLLHQALEPRGQIFEL